MNTSYDEYYRRQASQQGSGTVFAGPMIQRGYGLGGIFRNLFSFIQPVLKPAAKFLGHTLLKSGANVLSDVTSGAKLSDALKDRMSHAGTHIAKTALQKMGQMGSGIKRKRRTPKAQSKRRRLTRKTQKDIFLKHGSHDE